MGIHTLRSIEMREGSAGGALYHGGVRMEGFPRRLIEVETVYFLFLILGWIGLGDRTRLRRLPRRVKVYRFLLAPNAL